MKDYKLIWELDDYINVIWIIEKDNFNKKPLLFFRNTFILSFPKR